MRKSGLSAFDNRGRKPMAKKPFQDQAWRITLIRGSRGAYVGRVMALDADEAIKRAIVEHKITNREHQKRLAAQRVS
jgi:hypothetical protein